MIQIPKIHKPLDLGEYDEELTGQFINVWVNPPRAIYHEIRELQGEAIYKWYAEIWGTSAKDVKEFAEAATDTDPALWTFVIQETLGMIIAHRSGIKKALMMPYLTSHKAE